MKEAMFRLNDDLEMFPETVMITVQRKDLETLVKGLFFSAGEWSNQSAFGYAIAAAKSMELADVDIGLLVTAMSREFDSKTLEEAADNYRKSDF